jgi:hypothetical protein
MKLDSARELKSNLLRQVVGPLRRSATTRAALALPAGPLEAGPVPTLALGIARQADGGFALAVRVQQRALERSQPLDLIRRQAHNEVDVRFVGRIEKAAVPWPRQRHRPLAIGVSVAHYAVTAGTLGCFVRRPGSDALLLLSNNHVLANENRGKVGDAILQPGALDGGRQPGDVAGALLDFVKLKKVGANLVDAAVADLADAVEAKPSNLRGLGKLAGVGGGVIRQGLVVQKLGRTTGKRSGRVTAFELDNLIVHFDLGPLEFTGQIEVEGETEPFAEGGDSGSLTVDESRRAVGLLFAVTPLGGSSGQGVAYANPVEAVLKELNVEVVR